MLAALLAAALSAGAATDAFRRDVDALTRGPHRLTGSRECAAAFEYAASRFGALHPDFVVTQSFATVSLHVKRCELVLPDTGRTLALRPMRPNGIIPPVSPPAGIAGPIVHAGDGSAAQFMDTPVAGAIVVLDYNAGVNWMRAFRLGARAVIFVPNGPCEAWQPHSTDANANLPRYYYDGPRAELPAGADAVIRSEITWEPTEGRNLFALFEGHDPIFGQEQEEMIILAANLDTLGEVHAFGPGARAAANVAALLRLAERVQAQRPRRHVLFALFDAQTQGMLGPSRFYRALEADNGDVKVDARRKSLNAESEFVERLWDVLGEQRPLQRESSVQRPLLVRLRDRAKARAYEVGDAMFSLRTERLALEAEGGDEPSPAAQARMETIKRELETVWQPRKDEWNNVRRALGKNRTAGLRDGERQKLDIVLDDVREDLRLRRLEIEDAQRALAADAALYERVGSYWIALHASLMLGDTTSRWGLMIGGTSDLHSWDDNPGLYGKVQAVFLRAAQQLKAGGRPVAHFEIASADQSLPNTRALWGAPSFIHSGDVAGMFGIYNLAFGTCQEAQAREGTPDDTMEALDLDRIESQVDEVIDLLTAAADIDLVPPTVVGRAAGGSAAIGAWGVANQEGLSLRRGIVANKDYAIPSFSGETVTGPTVMGVLPGSSLPDRRMAGAVLQVRLREPAQLAYQARKPYAYQEFFVLRTDRNGTYELGPVRGGWNWGQMRGFAVVFDARGAAVSVSDEATAAQVRARLNVFDSRAAWAVLPPPFVTWRSGVGPLVLLSARDNAALAREKSNLQVFDGIAAWYADEREEGVKLFQLDTDIALNTGPEAHTSDEQGIDPLGQGFPMKPPWSPPLGSSRSAVDLWRLNASRLDMLQGKNIIDSSLSELHGRAEDLLLMVQTGSPTLRDEALQASAFMASRPVYTRTRRMVDDLVFAVLILLGISVPFAFALERVVVGATTIYRQIGWFAAFFAGTFVTLFLTHPAFAIANTPIIIFLGFAILILSLVVISIIMRRFETELKVLQGMPTTLHAADVSRMGTLMAAMQMGISTMRRRPLRTALTAVTIILLTFTILSFASFGTQVGVVRLFAAPVPPYAGVCVHDVNWNPIAEDILDVIRGRWRDAGELHARLWISPRDVNTPGPVLTRRDGARPVSIRGLLGITPDEIRLRADLRAVLDTNLADRVLITPAVARALKVSEGDEVLLSGVSLTVGRLIDPVAASVLTDMDGNSILPVDFTEARSAISTEESIEASLVAAVNYTSLPTDQIVVVDDGVAWRLGAEMRAWTLYTADRRAARLVAEDTARLLPLPVAATLDNGVFRHVLGTVVAASGAGDLLFPILLGGLVIFGTMLGSVADREREIYTFSALGLAPRHVATLFVAESLVYALIGGMGGYLLAQAVLRVLNALAAHGWVSVPEMNMSSTNTIVTILIVMGTVMLSALYPAIKASRSANPGLMRTWHPPDPEGDVMDMVFPFTVSEYDITGMVSFLKEHMDNHADVGLGRFMAIDTTIRREADGILGLKSSLTLAPFDLGVSQRFLMRSTPSEIPGIDEVRIRLERVAGQPNDWKRLNRVYLDDLRQQFLIWRALPEATMEIYRARTLSTLGEKLATDRPKTDT